MRSGLPLAFLFHLECDGVVIVNVAAVQKVANAMFQGLKSNEDVDDTLRQELEQVHLEWCLDGKELVSGDHLVLRTSIQVAPLPNGGIAPTLGLIILEGLVCQSSPCHLSQVGLPQLLSPVESSDWKALYARPTLASR